MLLKQSGQREARRFFGVTMIPTRKMPEPVLAAGNAQPMRADTNMAGCPWRDLEAMLRKVGLRSTRQRMALGWVLFGNGDRHLTAESLYEEAREAKIPVSLATIYNTLHQFTAAGLLRQVAVDGSRAYFDTNVSTHHHFLIEGKNELVDIPRADLIVGKTPPPPDGYQVARVEILVRLRKKR